MRGSRGEDKAPGEFRRTQNWIGPKTGGSFANATFVPPPVPQMNEAFGKLELYMHSRTEKQSANHLPVIIECALIHAQFETIHPFLDGNGRLGRLLIALLLHERRILPHPILYLSLYLKANRQEYYDRLTLVRRNGDWEGWVKFFLRGVEEMSTEALNTANRVIQFQREAVQKTSELGAVGGRALQFLFEHPLTDIQTMQQRLGISFNTASTALNKLTRERFVQEITGRQRNRVFRFSAYLDLFEDKPAAAPISEALAPPS
jgi:Fic family protein